MNAAVQRAQELDRKERELLDRILEAVRDVVDHGDDVRYANEIQAALALRGIRATCTEVATVLRKLPTRERSQGFGWIDA